MLNVLANRYEICREISKGEMGDLFLARDQMRGGQEVALKVIADRHGNGYVEALKAEYAILSEISHPNVVKIFDYGTDDERKRFYFSEEFVEGEPLNRLTGKLPFKSLLQISVQILQALAHLHDRGIVHGDIKPSNILVSGDRVTLVDFGLARIVAKRNDGVNASKASERGRLHPALPVEGATLAPENRPVGGTLPYLAPEILSGSIPRPRSDLYSVGILLFELSTGRLPFQMKDFFTALRVHLLESPPHPLRLDPTLPSEWADFILHLLNKDPLDRPRDAGCALRELNVSMNLRIPPSSLDSRFNRLQILPLVGLDGILQSLATFPEQDSFFVTVIEGARGLGKSRLLSELKKRYEQDRPVTVASGREEALPVLPGRGLLLVDDFDLLTPQKQLELLETVRRNGLKAVVTVAAWSRCVPLSHDSHRKIILKSLSSAETATLASSALACRLPAGFGDSLFDFTGGNPAFVLKMAAELVENHLIPFETVDKQLLSLKLTDLFVKDPVMGFRAVGKSPFQASLDRAIELHEEKIRTGGTGYAPALAELYYEKGEPTEVLRVLGELNGSDLPSRLLASKALIKMGDFKQAESLLPSEEAMSSLSASDRASCEMSHGIISFYRGQSREAIGSFLKSRDSSLAADDSLHASAADNSLGNVYARVGQEKRAVRFYNQALKRAREIYDVVGEGAYLMNIGNFYHQTGQFEEAVEHYCDSLNRFRRIGYRFELTRVLTNLANTHLQMGHVMRSKELIHEAISEAQEKNLLYQEGYAKLVRGDIFAYEGDIGEAEISYRSARDLFSRLGTRPEEMMARTGLMRCCVEKGDLEAYLKEADGFRADFPAGAAESVADDLERLAVSARFARSEIAGPQAIDSVREVLKKERKGGPKERAFLLFMERLARRRKDLVALNWIGVRLGRWVYALNEDEKPKLDGKTGWIIIRKLQAIHNLIVSGCPSKQVIGTILQEILEVSKSDRGLLILRNGDSFRVDASLNLSPSVARELGNRISTTITQGVFSSGLPSAMGETEAANPLVQSVFDLGLKSVFCLPLNNNGDTIGVIYADSIRSRNVRSDLPILQAFADLAAVAILHTKLFDSLQEENESLRRDLKALSYTSNKE